MKTRTAVMVIAIVIVLAACQSGPRPVDSEFISPANQKIQSALAGGMVIGGAAEGYGETWDYVLQATRFDPETGVFEAEISWPTLSAIHSVKGILTSTELQFVEVDFIQEGDAILDCVYTAELVGDGSRLDGTWGECLGYEGTFYLIVE